MGLCQGWNRTAPGRTQPSEDTGWASEDSIPFRGNLRKVIEIRVHSVRNEAPGRLLGAEDDPSLDLWGCYTGVCIYHDAASCPLRFVYFTACKIYLNKKKSITEEKWFQARESGARDRKSKVGAERAVSSRKERARRMKGWAEAEGCGKTGTESSRECGRGGRGGAEAATSTGGTAGTVGMKWQLGLRGQLTLSSEEPLLHPFTDRVLGALAQPGKELRHITGFCQAVWLTLVTTLGDKSVARFSDIPTTRQPWDASSCRHSELKREGLSFSLNSPTSAAHLTFRVCRWLGCDTRHLEQG